jgi:hypothetical protein
MILRGVPEDRYAPRVPGAVPSARERLRDAGA